MISIRLLRIEDTAKVLAFETINRDWFEQWVPPRPREYFHHGNLLKINTALVAEAAQGTAYMHLIFDADEQIIGRINLIDIHQTAPRTGELGYRIAQSATGQGIAVHAVKTVLDMAEGYGLQRLHAESLESNPASIAVLMKCGFTPRSAPARKIIWKGEAVALSPYLKDL